MAILPECRLEVEKKRLLGVFLTETEEIEAQLFYDSSTLINLSIGPREACLKLLLASGLKCAKLFRRHVDTL